MTLKMFGSQAVEIDEEQKILQTHLREPFYVAGKMFGWSGNTVGLSLSEEIIQWASDRDYYIILTVGSNPAKFGMSAKDWKAFVEKNKSIYKKDDKSLFVVQWSQLERLC